MNSINIVVCLFSLLLFHNVCFAQNQRFDSIELNLKKHFSDFSKFRITYNNLTHVPQINHPNYSIEQVMRYKDILERMKTNQLTEAEKKEFENFSEEDIKNNMKNIEKMLAPHTIHTIMIYCTDGNYCRADGYRDEDAPKHFYHIFDQINGYLITDDKEVTIRPSSGFTRQWVTPLYPIIFGSGIGRYLNYDFKVTNEDSTNQLITLTYPNRGDEIVVNYTLLENGSPYWTKCEIFFGEKLMKIFICEDFKDYNGLKIPVYVKEYKGKSLINEYFLEEAEINSVVFEPNFFQIPYTENMNILSLKRN